MRIRNAEEAAEQKVRLSVLISGGVFPLRCRQMDWCSLRPFSNKVVARGSRTGQSHHLHLITNDRRSCGQGWVALHTSPVNITSEPETFTPAGARWCYGMRVDTNHTHTPTHNLVSGEPGLRAEQVLDAYGFVTFSTHSGVILVLKNVLLFLLTLVQYKIIELWVV